MPTVDVHQYCLAGGWEVLVGKTDRDNDRLSRNVAGPNDYWFHVRGMPGSHVILRHDTAVDADRDTLHKAAAIAAFHSRARAGGTVAVSCTRAKHVRKPPGAKTGTVSVRRETVLKVTPALPQQDVP